MTKYCSNSSYGDNGFTDTKTELDPEDDVATANLGVEWRMPTHAEREALYSQCIWTEVNTYNGKKVKGYKVTGKNGNEIFLPAAGFRGSSSPLGVGSGGNYWSSSLNESDPSTAWNLYFYSGYVSPDFSSHRCLGFSVRPVRATQN